MATAKRPRLDKFALFNDTGYWPHTGQLAVHESRALRRVVACGVRWGKSKVGVFEVVAALLEPRDDESLGWVVGPDHVVSDRILKQAHRVLDVVSRGRLSVPLGGLVVQRRVGYLLSPHIGRDLHYYRAGPSVAQGVEGPPHDVGNLARLDNHF